MHFACLIGFGASAVNPYLAFEIIAKLREQGKIQGKLETTIESYITAIKKGLLKVMSKMGVSTIRSYRGAQIFEAVGLNEEFVNKFFPGTSSRIGGVGMEVIAREVLKRHAIAFSNDDGALEALDSGGKYSSVASRKNISIPRKLLHSFIALFVKAATAL
jgi:glutamate synthase domain-containing protein 2